MVLKVPRFSNIFFKKKNIDSDILKICRVMADVPAVETKKSVKRFWSNIEDKEKERRSIWRKNSTYMCGRARFEPKRSIDQFEEGCRR